MPALKQSTLGQILVPAVPSPLQPKIATFLDWLEQKSHLDSWDDSPFLPYELQEQRRIVARIEELAGKIEEATALRRQAAEETELLWPSALREVLVGRGEDGTCPTQQDAKGLLNVSAERHRGRTRPKYNNANPESPRIIDKGPTELPPGWVWTTLGSVLTHLVDCVNDTPDFTNEDTGLLGLKSTNVRPYRLDLTERWFMSREDFARWNRREQPLSGDILLTREAPMGYACLLPEGHEVALTQRLMLLRSDPLTVLPYIILHYLNSPYFRDQVEEKCRGLTTPHIRVQDAPDFILPLAPMGVQRRIVAELDALQAELDTLERLQTETAAELDVLLPSILDKAFKGEL